MTGFERSSTRLARPLKPQDPIVAGKLESFGVFALHTGARRSGARPSPLAAHSVVPEGAVEDETRRAEYYDGTFSYLHGLGLPVI